MPNYDGNEDPGINPRTAPVFSWGSVDQPYADRSIKAILWFLAIVIGVSMFFGWYMFGHDNNGQDIEERPPSEIARIDEKMPGNRYPEGSGRSGVYDFFYQMFGGIEDGLEDSPHNTKNVEWIDELNMEGDHIIGTPSPYTAEEAKEVINRLVEEYFDGSVLDYDGNIVGDVTAIKYSDGNVTSFNFALKDVLVPEDKAKLYTIPEDQVEVVQQDDVFYIQLNEEQTRGLAAALYDNESNRGQNIE
jgi:hypothetical protein